MKAIVAALLMACASSLGWAFANDAQRSAFERELFRPSVLSSFGIDQSRLNALSTKQREELLLARRVLLRFFRATQSNSPDVRSLVGAELLDQFPDQAAMLQKLFGQETEVLIGAITDFAFRSPKEIEVGYYIVLFADGRMLLRDDRAVLRRSGKDWFIVQIGGVR